MAIFLSVVIAVVAALHYYLWLRLIRDPGLSGTLRQALTGALIGLAVSLPLSFLLSRVFSPGVSRVVTFPIYLWMGLVFLLFVTLLGADLLRFLGWVGLRLARGSTPPDPERRELIARLVAGAVIVGTGGAVGVGAYLARSRLVTRRVEVWLPRLPRALDGLRVVQLTDLHLGPTLGRDFLEDVVARVNALKPDLIAITGDLVDGSVEQLRRAVEPLARLDAPQGVFFVTGNHEYYSGADEWIAHLRRLGVRVLRNERVAIGRGGESFDLAGIDDHHGGRMLPHHGPDLARATAGRDSSRELLLLAHQPLAIFDAARLGVGLQLSGHTHGGQIWPMGYLVRLQQPYIAGLIRHGGTQLYISEGTGFWGPPIRLGTRSEITEVTLRAGAARV